MSQQLPAAFIGPLFRASDDITVSTGWNYDEAEKAVHGVQNHWSIDFNASRGTPVLAATGGWAIATFGEFALIDEVEGKEVPRLDHGQPMWFGVGLMVQIWHGQGRYTQYCHLDSASDKIPFHQPATTEDGNLMPVGLAVPVAQYGKQAAARHIKAGEQIGTIGMTGCGLGVRSYEAWKAGRAYTSSYPDHLHFVVAGRRAPKTRLAARWDPFGLYTTVEAYPQDRSQWHKLPHSLFLPQETDTTR